MVRREAQVQGRSMADQVAHWLSIGRAIETSGRFSGSSIAKALAAEIPPSALTAEEHAVWMDLFIEKIEDVALVLLLPLFFVFTGLRTQIGSLNEAYLWLITGLIILTAVIGKFIGSALTAKFLKISWKDSLTIGALMNTRGLMGLVVLNIGLELKVLTPEVFTMMVIMALVTTFMTGPALDLIDYIFKTKEVPTLEEPSINNKYRILSSILYQNWR